MIGQVAVTLAMLLVLGWAAPSRADEIWQTLPAPAPPPPADVTTYVPNLGARIYVTTYGHGSPVILLHGGLANQRYWGNQVPALTRAGYRVILIDSRGHGRSTRTSQRYTYELMASDVVAVMDHLRLQKAAVVGWSDGAIVALVMALKVPYRLTHVFAFAANMDPSGVKEDTETNPTFARFERQAADDYAQLSATPDDYADFQQAIQQMWASEPNYAATDLATITRPVTIADGDHDEAIKNAHTEYLARSIPGAKLVILPQASHFAMLQQPTEFNAAVLAFLRGR